VLDSEPEFEISEILDSKVDCRHRTCKLLYLVHWSGYKGTDEEMSWLLATELGNTMELLENYHVRYPDHSRPCSITLASVSFTCFSYLFPLSVSFYLVISLTKLRSLFFINKSKN